MSGKNEISLELPPEKKDKDNNVVLVPMKEGKWPSDSSKAALPIPIARPASLNDADEAFIRAEVQKVLTHRKKIPSKTGKRGDKRLPFFQPTLEVQQGSPVVIMGKLYEDAKTPESRRACLHYLLHYQHYNAEFTVSESQRLGYPIPLCAPQTRPGYFRTEYNRSLELLRPWIDLNLRGFFTSSFSNPKKKIQEYIKVGSPSAISVMRTFFSRTHQVDELQSFDKKEETKGDKKDNEAKKTQVFIVRLSPNDLKTKALDILKERLKLIDPKFKFSSLKGKKPQPVFLFLLEVPAIECTLLWGARITFGKNDKEQLQCFPLDLDDFFGEDIFSLLNQAGAFPDRLALNCFMTHALGDEKASFSSDLKNIGIAEPDSYEVVFDRPNQVKAWKQRLEEMAYYKFEDEPGCALYRDAIRRWQDVFFTSHSDIEPLVVPLLYHQVLPWMTKESGIIQWAKAYQNLCETVMFCLEYFPELSSKVDFEQTVLRTLDPRGQLANTYKSVGLYSYGMSSIFDIFHQILRRPDVRGNPLSLACISQTYFETLILIERMEEQGHISTQKAVSLVELRGIPDILIADIHPNNAAQDKLFQNDIVGWVESALGNASRKIILILDITLNHLSDSIVQRLLERLNRFVTNNQLEVFFIQSLAKLVQMGPDNFSGGTCIYWGGPQNKIDYLASSKSLPQKSAFFCMLTQHFQDLIARYFLQVRQNSDRMYHQLSKCCSRILKKVWIDTGEGKGSKSSFCATNITLNVDIGTVYVAIGFKSFFEQFKIIDEEEREKWIKRFLSLLLELATLRGLPITGRQSFGFSFSNMSATAQAIRFSIGVENSALLVQYVEVFEEFSYGLSKYIADHHNNFDMNTFEAGIKSVYKTLREGGDVVLLATIPLLKEGVDEYGSDIQEEIGSADIYFKEHQLCLDISQQDNEAGVKKIKQMSEPNIDLVDRWFSHYNDSYWSYRDLFYLLLELKLIKSDIVYVHNDGIGGFWEDGYLFRDDSEVKDEQSGISVVFKPEFSLTRPDGSKFDGHHVFVDVSELSLGTQPVPLSRLDSGSQGVIFTQCVQYHVEAPDYKEEPGFVILKFPIKKSSVNYLKRIERLFLREGGLPRVVIYLNSIDLENLPLYKGQSWHAYSRKPIERLHNALQKLGAYIIDKLVPGDLNSIVEIADKNCRRVLIEGMFDGFCSRCLSKGPLDSGVAKTIAQMFSMKEFQQFIDFHSFERWIIETSKYMANHPEDIEQLGLYLSAAFPLVQHFYENPGILCRIQHSIPLRNIAEGVAICFPDLKKYMVHIEQLIPRHVALLKEARGLNSYLELYLNYSLSEDIKRNLLLAIRQKPEEWLNQWISWPGFNYEPLDRFDMGMASVSSDENLILYKEDQAAVRAFFDEIGCKDILLKRVSQEKTQDIILTTLRWGIITQDCDLFSRVLEVLKEVIFDEINDEFKRYVFHLDKSDPTQNELAKLINSIVETASKRRAKLSEPTSLPSVTTFDENQQKEVVNNIFQRLMQEKGHKESKSESKSDNDKVKEYILALMREGEASDSASPDSVAQDISLSSSVNFIPVSQEGHILQQGEYSNLADRVFLEDKKIEERMQEAMLDGSFQHTAFVNAENSTFNGTGGISGAFHDYFDDGRDQLFQASRDVRGGKTLAVDEAVLIPVKKGEHLHHIIQTTGPNWQARNTKPKTEKEVKGDSHVRWDLLSLSNCYFNTLAIIRFHNEAHPAQRITKIVFPSISNGIFGVPDEVAIPAQLEGIRRFFSQEYAANSEIMIVMNIEIIHQEKYRYLLRRPAVPSMLKAAATDSEPPEKRPPVVETAFPTYAEGSGALTAQFSGIMTSPFPQAALRRGPPLGLGTGESHDKKGAEPRGAGDVGMGL